jgi:hypothetical protein
MKAESEEQGMRGEQIDENDDAQPQNEERDLFDSQAVFTGCFCASHAVGSLGPNEAFENGPSVVAE